VPTKLASRTPLSAALRHRLVLAKWRWSIIPEFPFSADIIHILNVLVNNFY